MTFKTEVIIARFSGENGDMGFRRGLVYKLEMKRPQLDIFKAIVRRIFPQPFAHTQNNVQVRRMTQHGPQGIFFYKDMNHFLKNWTIEKNNFFRNAEKGIK